MSQWKQNITACPVRMVVAPNLLGETNTHTPGVHQRLWGSKARFWARSEEESPSCSSSDAITGGKYKQEVTACFGHEL